jgi:hypothetical protein
MLDHAEPAGSGCQTRGIGNRFAPLLCRCFLAVPPLLFVLFLWPKMWLIQLLRPVDGDVSAANSGIPRPAGWRAISSRRFAEWFLPDRSPN